MPTPAQEVTYNSGSYDALALVRSKGNGDQLNLVVWLPDEGGWTEKNGVPKGTGNGNWSER